MPYLDQASTSFPKPKEVSEAIADYLNHHGVSPGRGNYRLADFMDQKVMETRKLLARFLSIDSPENIVFTQNATHSLNLILKGFLKEGDHVILCQYSHNASLRPLESLKRQKKIEFDLLPVGLDGHIDVAQFIRLIRPATRLLVCTEASNVIGVKSQFEDVLSHAKSHSIATLIDTTQSLGYVSSRPSVDFLVGTGHKTLLGPTGIGFFYVKNPALIESLFEGGSPGNSSLSRFHPEQAPYKFEAGTMNGTGILGLLGALRYIETTQFQTIRKKSMVLLDSLLRRLLAMPDVTVYGSTDLSQKIPLVSINLRHKLPQEVAYQLDRRYDIAVRAGLHCAPLMHQKLNTAPEGTVRISLGHFNTADEVDLLLKAIETIQNERA